MSYMDAFKANEELIKILGLSNAHLVWSLGLYIEEPDLESLASEGLTDGPDDKKIDFIYFEPDTARIIFAQGYYSSQKKDTAPSNKASDLNTASAWLMSGNLTDVPERLQPVFEVCRDALEKGDVASIELLYVHNLPESVNVTKELQTVATHLRLTLGEGKGINVSARELGQSQIENLFLSQESHIEVKNEVLCPAKIQFQERGPKWAASVMTVPGSWLQKLFVEYGEALFSANYRGFLGITKRRKINTGIRTTAEGTPQDFWVFNNGITLLTYKAKQVKDGTSLAGISVINGAQTTGSIGSVDIHHHDLKEVRVLCRVIECSDPDTIGDIVRFNNTQNEITTWDQYSRDPEQLRLESEFKELGYKYSRKRGFRMSGDQIGIEEVAQPLIAFYGRFQDANRGKNRIFDRKPLYNQAFSGKKARHILFVYALARAIDERRVELKNKSTGGSIITIEEEQLRLLRNLKFKYFLVSIIASVMETIVGKKLNKETVAWSPDIFKNRNKSIIDLTAAWSPIVESVITFLTTQVESRTLSDLIVKEEALENVSKNVGALLYSNRNYQPFQSFTLLVSDS
jgi:hypothetical protein